MLKEFQEYLKRQVKVKSLPYYVKWIIDCHTFLGKEISQRITNEEKE